MRIVKQGKVPGEKPYRTTCSNCSTVFEFNRVEAKLCTQPNGLKIDCPLCQQAYFVSEAAEIAEVVVANHNYHLQV
jgi:hypothetical protein